MTAKSKHISIDVPYGLVSSRRSYQAVPSLNDFIHLVSAVAAVVFSQLSASKSASWSLVRSPLSCISASGHELMM